MTFVVAGLIGSLVWQRFYNTDARIRRALKHVPHTPMRELRDGKVGKIVGKLLPGEEAPFTAPLTRRRCAYYLVVVEEQSRNGWHQVLSEERAQDFFLCDRDGTRALVRMNEARVSVVRDAA